MSSRCGKVRTKLTEVWNRRSARGNSGENSECRSRKSAQTPSFSSHSSEHVEYINRPPLATVSDAFSKIRSCLQDSSSISVLVIEYRISGLCRIVPVPEQGASTKTESKLCATNGKQPVASSWTT